MNRLSHERSPYLLQHAANPVDWYPWGTEAFARAKQENKPVFLSVGYSTCHWCHVMNRESFSNPAIAAYMNAHFINIKLDREERPDVDQVYMTFVQASGGGGGWPMSVWMTPDLTPIVGGTYFPPRDAYGRPGFLTVLQRVADAWASDEPALRAQASAMTERLLAYTAAVPDDDGPVGEAPLVQALSALQERFDSEWGGFGDAPKFPRPCELAFLFQRAHRLGLDTDTARQAVDMAVFTLESMACGGMHDQVGGGFHRYSVDRFWHVPHYEKMLYDQAQLVEAFLTAHQLTGRADFADMARRILAYVERDLTNPQGGFHSAEDADSLPHPTAEHKTEGAFYVWEETELRALLGADADLFIAVHGVEADGNSPHGSDPHGELRGKNTLVRRLDDAEAAAQFGLDASDVHHRLALARECLLAARSQRPRPHLDDKVITAWNGLMISACAKAFQVLEDPAFLAAANRAADFLHRELYDHDTRTLHRTWRKGQVGPEGFAADYAFLIQGLLDLYQAGFDTARLAWALDLQTRQNELFQDPLQGGYFNTTGNDPSVLLRMKDRHDGAEPSPNSVSALNQLRLAHLLADPSFTEQAERTLASLTEDFRQHPLAVPLGLTALQRLQNPGPHLVLVGEPDAPSLRAMLRIFRRRFLPGAGIVLLHHEKARSFFTGRADFYRELQCLDGKPTAYLCENFTCQRPTTDPETLAQLLS